MSIRRTITTLSAAGLLALGGATGTALAKHGSDDGAGHHRGDDHGQRHGGHGSDDGAGHHRGRGRDDESGHRRGRGRGRGTDDGPNHT